MTTEAGKVACICKTTGIKHTETKPVEIEEAGKATEIISAIIITVI